MFGNIAKSASFALTILSCVGMISADIGKVIACTRGFGQENGCSGCDNSTAIPVTDWFRSTKSGPFHLDDAEPEKGGGYDVWWNVFQPDPSCRVILYEPFITEQGSIDPRISGNVILSVSHAGCYYTHVTNRGVSAGFCCGSGDCRLSGAYAISKKKRELSAPSRITRSQENNDAPRWGESLDRRNPQAAPAVSCTAPVPKGDSFTKSAIQQVDGRTLNCKGGASCSFSPSMSVSVSDSLTSTKEHTFTTKEGTSAKVTAGFQFAGFYAKAEAGFTKEISNAVTTSTGMTKTNTVTKSLTLNIGLVPGNRFNLWFSPTVRCQMLVMTCQGVEMPIEKCVPELDSAGNPVGSHGIMTVG